MAEAFDVDPDVYAVYAFAYSELCEELADGDGRSEKNPMGCTNVLVTPPTADTDGGLDQDSNGRVASTSGPLVLKNRDIAGRGTRPKSIIQQPPIDSNLDGPEHRSTRTSMDSDHGRRLRSSIAVSNRELGT